MNMKFTGIIILIVALCTSCATQNPSPSTTTTTTPTTIETTISVKKNPYYRYPINDLSVEEIKDELFEIRDNLLTSETISEFQSKFNYTPVSMSEGYNFSFIDNLNYGYSDQGVIDNIELVQVLMQVQGNRFTYSPTSALKIVCVLRENSKAEKLYESVAEVLKKECIVDTDHRGDGVWSLFVIQGDNVLVPLCKYTNNNNGFYIVEVVFPVTSPK